MLALAAALATPAAAQSWRTLDVSRQPRDTAPLQMRVSYGAGRLAVRAASTPALYAMQLSYDAERVSPLDSYDAVQHTAHLGVTGRHASMPGEDAKAQMRLDLSRAHLLDLVLELGAVSADVNLSGLRVDRLRVESGGSEASVSFDTLNATPMRALDVQVGAATFRGVRLANANASEMRVAAGAGTADLDFGGTWTHDVDLRLQLTLGAATVTVPSDVGVMVETGRFLTRFEHAGLIKRGDAWVSENYDRAAHKLRVRSETTLGTLEIRRGDS